MAKNEELQKILFIWISLILISFKKYSIMIYLGRDLVSPNFWSRQVTDLASADYSQEGGNFFFCHSAAKAKRQIRKVILLGFTQ